MNKKCKAVRVFSLGFVLGILLLFSMVLPSQADPYPNRPIEMVVQYSPGSGTDVIARVLAHAARKYISQPIVVINKAGGGGVVGNEYVITAKPDGYSILFGLGSGETLLAPHMQKLPHDPITSIKTVMLVTEAPIVFSVKGDSPFKGIKDVVDFAKKNPGKVSFAASTGGFTQIVPEVLAYKAGTKFIFMPTTGTGVTLTNVMGGHVTFGSLHPSVAIGPAKSGKIRLLAISSEKRNDDMPNVPTMKEEGYDIVMTAIKGIGVPKDTPDEIVRYLHDGFKKAIADPEFVGAMDKLGEQITYKNSKDFGNYLKLMDKKCDELIKAIGLAAK